MGVHLNELVHHRLREFKRAESIGVLEVGRRQREERRVVNAVRILELQVVVDRPKQPIGDFLVLNLVIYEALQVFQLNVALGHRIKRCHDLIINYFFLRRMEHGIQFLHRRIRIYIRKT